MCHKTWWGVNPGGPSEAPGCKEESLETFEQRKITIWHFKRFLPGCSNTEKQASCSVNLQGDNNSTRGGESHTLNHESEVTWVCWWGMKKERHPHKWHSAWLTEHSANWLEMPATKDTTSSWLLLSADSDQTLTQVADRVCEDHWVPYVLQNRLQAKASFFSCPHVRDISWKDADLYSSRSIGVLLLVTSSTAVLESIPTFVTLLLKSQSWPWPWRVLNIHTLQEDFSYVLFNWTQKSSLLASILCCCTSSLSLHTPWDCPDNKWEPRLHPGCSDWMAGVSPLYFKGPYCCWPLWTYSRQKVSCPESSLLSFCSPF